MTPLQAPFPYFGGKKRVAADVWERFGDVPNFVEPFAGSLAVLLGRPPKHVGKIETVNDLDGFLCNAWRAIAADPEATAAYADWPVIEADLHARHAHLVGVRESLLRKLEGDPDFYDPLIAGWWVAGVCAWIGSGYCSGEGPWVVHDGELVKRGGNAVGRGVKRQLPHLGNAGQGVNRQGVKRKLPHLSAGQGINRQSVDIYRWFAALAERLRGVRVCNGDWERVVTESVTTRHGMTAVFLDPPYGEEVEQTRIYGADSGTVAGDVRAWCLANGDNALLRIALCGYEGEGHEQLLDHGWTVHAWRAHGGYGGGLGGVGEANRHRERIYFSPHCIAPEAGLFDLGGAS